MPTKYENQRQKVTQPHIGLADLRKSHGLTQATVAEKVSSILDMTFTSSSLSVVEGGHRGASPEVLAALEQVFGLGAGSMRVDYIPSHSRRPKDVA